MIKISSAQKYYIGWCVNVAFLTGMMLIFKFGVPKWVIPTYIVGVGICLDYIMRRAFGIDLSHSVSLQFSSADVGVSNNTQIIGTIGLILSIELLVLYATWHVLNMGLVYTICATVTFLVVFILKKKSPEKDDAPVSHNDTVSLSPALVSLTLKGKRILLWADLIFVTAILVIGIKFQLNILLVVLSVFIFQLAAGKVLWVFKKIDVFYEFIKTPVYSRAK